MNCPICQSEIRSEPFKKWEFSVYEVARYECPSCQEKFNTYTSKGELKFTIPR